jgi:uncharacterized membrane protein YczE
VFTLPTAADVRRGLPRLILGLVAFGVGLALMVGARLGLGPWEVLNQGLSRHIGIPIGTTGIFVGMLVLLAWVPLRQRLGIGTVTNVVLIGVTIDLMLAVLPEPDAIVARVAFLVIGVTLTGLGSGLYLGVGLGAGPRDGLMTGIAGRTGHSIRLVRTAMELSALGAGWALGGDVGVGTVLFAVAIGPLVQLFLGPLTLGQRDEAVTLTAPAE